MAKNIDYPRASLRSALQLAEAVDGFGGGCGVELAAEQLGKKLSGAFSAQVGATVKYGLIGSKAGKLSVTPLYKEYKLSYTPEEASRHLRAAFLSPPLFRAIFDRFKGQKLPVQYFEKMLIKEFEVPSAFSSRVAGYFLEGAKQAALLTGDNVVIAEGQSSTIVNDNVEEEIPLTVEPEDVSEQTTDSRHDETSRGNLVATPSITEDYWLNMRGPGVNFSIEIKDGGDLEIVQIMLKKIERALKLPT